METTQFTENSEKKSQLNILVSKYRGANNRFLSMEIFLLKFQSKSCKLWQHPNNSWENMLECDINFFEITLPPHRCLLGDFSCCWGLFPCIHLKWWYLLIQMMIFIDLFKLINLRSSLPGYVLEKKCSLYIWGTPRKTRGIYQQSLTFFCSKVLKFCQLHMLNSFIQQCFSPWCKVNGMEKFQFVKFRPLVYLEPCKTSMMELFCEYMNIDDSF